jgi:hypothetical protein
MKKQFMNKLTILAICLFALSLTAFGQKTDKTKENLGTTMPTRPTKPVLKATEADKKVLEGMIQSLEVRGKKFPKMPKPKGAYVSANNEKYTFGTFEWEEKPTRKDLIEGVDVGIIYVEAGSTKLPNGYYTVRLWQVKGERGAKPQYAISLINSNGVQALAIGPKTNGAAGNSTGLGAKRVANVTNDKPTNYADYEAVGNQLEDIAFVKSGDKEVLNTDNLPQQIVEMVAAFVSTTKSNIKNA